MKRVFIINSQAARGKACKKWQRLARDIAGLKSEEVVICLNWHEIKQQASKALLDGAKLVVAVGGDGTAGQVASAFFRNGINRFPDATLAILPVGSGCDFFRFISGKIKPTDLLRRGQTQKFDVMYVTTDEKQIYGINTASIGLPTEIILRKERVSYWIPDFLCYLVPTIQSILKFVPCSYSLWIDGRMKSSKVLALFITKGLYGGGGMKLGEPGDYNSGRLAVTLVPPVGIGKFLRYILQIYLKGLRSVPIVEAGFAHQIRLEDSVVLTIEVDGDLYPFNSLEIKVLPKAINVLCYFQAS